MTFSYISVFCDIEFVNAVWGTFQPPASNISLLGDYTLRPLQKYFNSKDYTGGSSDEDSHIDELLGLSDKFSLKTFLPSHSSNTPPPAAFLLPSVLPLSPSFSCLLFPVCNIYQYIHFLGKNSSACLSFMSYCFTFVSNINEGFFSY